MRVNIQLLFLPIETSNGTQMPGRLRTVVFHWIASNSNRSKKKLKELLHCCGLYYEGKCSGDKENKVTRPWKRIAP
jgi:hypothetical protein